MSHSEWGWLETLAGLPQDIESLQPPGDLWDPPEGRILGTASSGERHLPQCQAFPGEAGGGLGPVPGCL